MSEYVDSFALEQLFGITGIENQPNQLHMELVGTTSNWNSFALCESSSRAQMMCSHLSQLPVIAQPQIRRVLSGVEREYGKYTFNVRMPETGEITAIIERYPVYSLKAKEKPGKLVIYRAKPPGARNQGKIYFGCLTLTDYHSLHQYFGFNFRRRPECDYLHVGSMIDKHTVFMESPNLDEHGNYRIGCNVDVFYSSHHGGIEDGFILGEHILPQFTSTGIESRTESWGKTHYPLNLCGNDDVYKPHPDIGECIGENGLMFALREHNPITAVVEMTREATQKVDYHFDRLVYAKPGAKVIDIDILHDYNLQRHTTPEGMYGQQSYYYDARVKRAEKLIAMDQQLQKEHRDRLMYSHQLRMEIREAYGLLNTTGFKTRNKKPDSKVVGTYRRVPLDDWRVEVTFSYDIVPSVGSKLTNLRGGKGVCVGTLPEEKMPIDDFGNRVGLIAEGDSIIKRMNIGGPYEQAMNIFCRQMSNLVRDIMGDRNGTLEQRYKLAYKELMDFYTIASPLFARALGIIHRDKPERRNEHVDNIVVDGIYLMLPSNSPNLGSEVIIDLYNKYGLESSPLTIWSEAKGYVRTKRPMIHGEVYIVMLEKNGSDWAAVSSGKRQHYGLLARLTNSDKYSTPGRENPVRITGEAEIRLLLALLPPDIVAEILDQPNNPAAHKAAVRSVLTAIKPGDIERAVDRVKYPLGGNRATMFVLHILKCYGIGLDRWSGE